MKKKKGEQGWDGTLLENSNIALSLRRKVLSQSVLPVLMYGAETWTLTKNLERTLRGSKGNEEVNGRYIMVRQESSIVDWGTHRLKIFRRRSRKRNGLGPVMLYAGLITGGQTK